MRIKINEIVYDKMKLCRNLNDRKCDILGEDRVCPRLSTPQRNDGEAKQVQASTTLRTKVNFSKACSIKKLKIFLARVLRIFIFNIFISRIYFSSDFSKSTYRTKIRPMLLFQSSNFKSLRMNNNF